MKSDFNVVKIIDVLLKCFINFLKILLVNFISISHFFVSFDFVFDSFQNNLDNLSVRSLLF